MERVIVGGEDLAGFTVEKPAASVRVLLPSQNELKIPLWNGNEFLLADGSRPTIRTLTPRRFDETAFELHLDVVLHGAAPASTWASRASTGDEIAVSGPGRGYDIDPDATAFVLAGDETAIPAICQLLEHLPDVPIETHIVVRHIDAQVDLHRDVDIRWHLQDDATPDLLLAAIQSANLEQGTHIWAAGEAASMQRIRNHLFKASDFPRSHANVRGYWKQGSD